MRNSENPLSDALHNPVILSGEARRIPARSAARKRLCRKESATRGGERFARGFFPPVRMTDVRLDPQSPTQSESV